MPAQTPAMTRSWDRVTELRRSESKNRSSAGVGVDAGVVVMTPWWAAHGSRTVGFNPDQTLT
jgi:hypothetical protein